MGLAIGFLLFLLGLVTFWAWLPATLPFLQGLVAFSLILWGFITMIVSISERKAKREFKTALNDQKSPAEAKTEAKQEATQKAA